MADRPGAFPEGLRQPDRRSCGAACLVVAEALQNPAYADRVAVPAAFHAEVLAMHRRVTSAVDVSGHLQLPWPAALGTAPWGAARQLSGTTGVHHRVVPLCGGGPRAAYDVLLRSRPPSLLYVGSRWLPRHVVLVLEASPESIRAYEPAGGRIERVPAEAFGDRRLELGGWDVPWFAVVSAPRARRTPASPPGR